MAKLIVTLSEIGVVAHELSGEEITVGSALGNTIRLDDPSVAPHHARFILQKDGYRVEDLGSALETWVNGVSARHAEVSSPCVIRFGDLDCVFLPELPFPNGDGNGGDASHRLLHREVVELKLEKEALETALRHAEVRLRATEAQREQWRSAHERLLEQSAGASLPIAPAEHAPEGPDDMLCGMHSVIFRLSINPNDRPALQELFGNVRELAQRTDIHTARRMASTLEALIGDLCRVPEELDSGKMRTVTRAVETLCALSEQSADESRDPPGARMCVISDDAEEPMIVATRLVDFDLSTFHYPTERWAAVADVDCELLVLDAGEHGLSAEEVSARIRDFPRQQATPIIVLTSAHEMRMALLDPALRDEDDFIEKPFNVFELAVKIVTAIFRNRLKQSRSVD
ncbi:MAG: hypothetical protein QOD99_1505 [Chthoniobacter sp.]|jgi:CheY-like chemotaxis protein|nr:hypothetical protein [Chthoniobacter sp.]